MFRQLRFQHLIGFVGALSMLVQPGVADVKMPALFADHMVLQRDQPNRVWGWDQPETQLSVTIANQKHETRAGKDGRFEVTLEALPAGGPHKLVVRGTSTVTIQDVLVGEVWICSGQSNMAFPVSRAYDADLATRTANYPKIRLISVPQVGTQTPQYDFQGTWKVCSPESVADFSAVGYYFGRQLHLTLGVPVGLIDNAWGGSACEAWISRDTLEADQRYQPLMKHWDDLAKNDNHDEAVAEHQQRLERWRKRQAEARQAGNPPPSRPRAPRDPLVGQHRPANLFNGVLKPSIGYGIRGAIWYQGEANSARAEQYRSLFPLMISHWRDEWGQGDFPFYWVQLADYLAEKDEPGDSAWAELREAQTLTMSKLPHTGQAVITDLGEGKDIHPRNKLDVAKRLARWALANEYGLDIVHRSPQFQEMTVQGNRAAITFDVAGSALSLFDDRAPRGFAICGEDRKFVWAQARLVDDKTVEVWSDGVPQPVAVRYAWADNPVCNLLNREGLPVTPFRTDDWPGVTAGKHVR